MNLGPESDLIPSLLLERVTQENGMEILELGTAPQAKAKGYEMVGTLHCTEQALRASHGGEEIIFVRGDTVPGKPGVFEFKRYERLTPEAKAARERLFMGVYPAGIVYADRKYEVGGDYARLGFLPYDTLELSLEKRCTGELRKLVVAEASKMQARRGQQFKISTAGQTVLLGSKSAPRDAIGH